MRLTPTKLLELESYEAIRAQLRNIVREENSIMKRNLMMDIVQKMTTLGPYELSFLHAAARKMSSVKKWDIDPSKEVVVQDKYVIRTFRRTLKVKKFVSDK